MAEINLPQRFKDKLESAEKKYHAIILNILTNFEDILNASSLEFFPEYNNHGITHLNNIFKIQDELITDESFKLLTVNDITTLIIATLSHDIGMHLNYEGFQTLIKSDLQFSEKWNKKWIKFFQLSKKYNERKLNNLFGDSEPIINLPKTKQLFRTKDYLLIGEFLRINHPELAQDILKYGFPIASNKVMQLSTLLKDEKKILNFSSLLSKSHGMNLRDTFNEIEEIGYEDNLVFAYNIHIIYLMIILRLSDYLDIYKNRHPKIILGLKNFISDISMFEWNKNTSITDEQPYHKDKEAITLGVEPMDSISYINLKNLFKGIQHELDISWAVLGEIYSRDENLKNFGIKFRRIRTNIDDEIAFNKKVDYIPKKISFDSDPELLKLLIAPLYGDDPSYGVRELLQNAVDACKEYKELNKDPKYEPNIHVNTFKENDKYYFEIIDNGLGMTEDTIINYLLKAGASFRNSDIWREKFEDSAHHSKVERTGRFGVGLLASFLLGNNIEVKTKYFNSKTGFLFNTQLMDNQINIIKHNSIDSGTSIKIEMSEQIYKKLNNNNNWKKWYLLTDINIFYNKKLNDNTIKEEDYLEINQNDFTVVKWFYEEKEKQYFICNGFHIPKGKIDLYSSIDLPYTYHYKDYYSNVYMYKNYFKNPSLIIMDKDGKLPLSLSREKLLKNNFNFENLLVKSISNKLFNFFINHNISKNNLQELVYINYPLFEKKRWKDDNVNLYQKLLFNNDGFNLLHSYTIEKNKLEKLIFIELNTDSKIENSFLKLLLENNNTILIEKGAIRANSYGYSYLFNILEQGILNIDKDFAIKSANIIMPKEKYKKLFTYKNTYITRTLKDEFITKTDEIKKYKKELPASEETNSFAINYYKNKSPLSIDLKELDRFSDEIGLIIEINIDYKNPKEKNIEYYFYNLMKEYFKDKDNYWLPYSD
jgi:hypothetical protein